MLYISNADILTLFNLGLKNFKQAQHEEAQNNHEQAQKRYSVAKMYFENCIEETQKNSIEDIKAVIANIASFYTPISGKNAPTQESIALRISGIETMNSIFPQNSTDGALNIAIAHNDLGDDLHKMGKKQEALEHFITSLKIAVKNIPSEESLAIIANNVNNLINKLKKEANEHIERNEYSEALNIFINLYNTVKENFPTAQLEIGSHLADIGLCKLKLGRFEEALEDFYDALPALSESTQASNIVMSLIAQSYDTLIKTHLDPTLVILYNFEKMLMTFPRNNEHAKLYLAEMQKYVLGTSETNQEVLLEANKDTAVVEAAVEIPAATETALAAETVAETPATTETEPAATETALAAETAAETTSTDQLDLSGITLDL